MFEVRKWYTDLKKSCSVAELDLDYKVYDVPLVAAVMVFGSIIAFLSWILYYQFGWKIYKKLGADINMQGNKKRRKRTSGFIEFNE